MYERLDLTSEVHRHAEHFLMTLSERPWLVTMILTIWTLTVVLDFKTGRMVSLSSNARQLMSARGTFETVQQAPQRPETRAY